MLRLLYTCFLTDYDDGDDVWTTLSFFASCVDEGEIKLGLMCAHIALKYTFWYTHNTFLLSIFFFIYCVYLYLFFLVLLFALFMLEIVNKRKSWNGVGGWLGWLVDWWCGRVWYKSWIKRKDAK